MAEDEKTREIGCAMMLFAVDAVLLSSAGQAVSSNPLSLL